MFSFDGECVYEDLRCLRNKTNMPEENIVSAEKHLSNTHDSLVSRLSKTMPRETNSDFLPCNQQNEIGDFGRYALEKH